MSTIVSLENLSRTAVDYNNVLRALPAVLLQETLKSLKLNTVEVAGSDIEISKRRRAGIMGAYKPGMEIKDAQELNRFIEMELKPQLVYASLRDNIQNYREKKLLSNAGEVVNQRTKKHPLEALILQDVVTSFAEDIAYAAFFAERDEEKSDTLSSFDGFYTKLNRLIVEGYVSNDLKNSQTTGAIAAPTGESDTAAYDRLVEFIGQTHNMLRRGGAQLYCAESVIRNARKAFANKVKSHSYPTTAQMLDALRDDAFCPQLDLLTHPVLGTGSQLMLTKPGMLDLGLAPTAGAQFVQVRSIDKDPNVVDFWIQSAYDTRIKDVHPKVFSCNEQKNSAETNYGDFKL